MTAVQVEGIKQYLDFIIEKQVGKGLEGSPDFNSYSSYGSMLSMMMTKSYQ